MLEAHNGEIDIRVKIVAEQFLKSIYRAHRRQNSLSNKDNETVFPIRLNQSKVSKSLDKKADPRGSARLDLTGSGGSGFV